MPKKTKKIKRPKCPRLIHPSFMALHLKRKHGIAIFKEQESEPSEIQTFLNYLENRKQQILSNTEKTIQSIVSLEIEIRSLLD